MKFAIILLLGVLEKCVAPGCSSIKTPAYCLGPGFDNGLSLNLPKYIKASSLEDDDALNAATTPDMMCFWCVTEMNKQNKPISGVCNMCTGLVTGQIATNGESKCLKVYTRSRFNPKDHCTPYKKNPRIVELMRESSSCTNIFDFSNEVQYISSQNKFIMNEATKIKKTSPKLSYEYKTHEFNGEALDNFINGLIVHKYEQLETEKGAKFQTDGLNKVKEGLKGLYEPVKDGSGKVTWKPKTKLLLPLGLSSLERDKADLLRNLAFCKRPPTACGSVQCHVKGLLNIKLQLKTFKEDEDPFDTCCREKTCEDVFCKTPYAKKKKPKEGAVGQDEIGECCAVMCANVQDELCKKPYAVRRVKNVVKTTIKECCEEQKTCSQYTCSSPTLKKKESDKSTLLYFSDNLQENCCTNGFTCEEKRTESEKKCNQKNLVFKQNLPAERVLSEDLEVTCCESLSCRGLQEREPNICDPLKEFDHDLDRVVQSLDQKESMCCSYNCTSLDDDKICPDGFILSPEKATLELKKATQDCCVASTTCAQALEQNLLKTLCPDETYVRETSFAGAFKNTTQNIIQKCCKLHGETFDTCEHFIAFKTISCNDGDVPSKVQTTLVKKIRLSEFPDQCCVTGFNCKNVNELEPKCRKEGPDMFPKKKLTENLIVHESDVITQCCVDGKSCAEYECTEYTLPNRLLIEADMQMKRAIENLQNDCCVNGASCEDNIQNLNMMCKEHAKIGNENVSSSTYYYENELESKCCREVLCSDISTQCEKNVKTIRRTFPLTVEKEDKSCGIIDENSNYDEKIATCLDELCCGFRCSKDSTICSDDTKMFSSKLENVVFEQEDSCCVPKHYCRDHTNDIEKVCTYTNFLRPKDKGPLEPFEEENWEENCCEKGFKCSDVKELNAEWCNEFEKYYDKGFTESEEMLTLDRIHQITSRNDKVGDIRNIVADLCCVDIKCVSTVCDAEDSRMKEEMGDMKIPLHQDSFEYCCGYDCTKVIMCEDQNMLPLRNLNELPLQDHRENCCDPEVTTCDTEKDVLDCGDGFAIRQDQSHFSNLIYKDTAREFCCEEKVEEKVEKKKEECCFRKGPLVQIRYFQSSSPQAILQPDNSASFLRGALEKLAEEVDQYVGTSSSSSSSSSNTQEEEEM